MLGFDCVTHRGPGQTAHLEASAWGAALFCTTIVMRLTIHGQNTLNLLG